MKHLFKGAVVYTESGLTQTDVLVRDGVIVSIGSDICDSDAVCYELHNCFLFPGFTDVHVHLREPGFSFKETIATGTAAAARGGYTTVCAMPNLNPVPDSAEHLQMQLDKIASDARINVYPYAAITVGEKGGELADMDELAKNAVAFSDDGKGVQNEEMMKNAMIKAKSLGKIIAAHCEDESLLRGGYIHDGEYAKAHGHAGICSESEWGPIKRDIELVRETGCAYHVCHVSTKESVELIRKAKAEGVDITCETAPHYLVLDDSDLQEHGRFKMNPPLRAKEDREALIEGVLDGTIDILATDHAPHTAEEKNKGLKGSPMGVVGLETAFAIMYTKLVKEGVMSLERLLEMLCDAPCRRFGVGTARIAVGERADLTVFDVSEEYVINPGEFASMGRATPFEGERVFGRCKMTMVGGEMVWKQ